MLQQHPTHNQWQLNCMQSCSQMHFQILVQLHSQLLGTKLTRKIKILQIAHHWNDQMEMIASTHSFLHPLVWIEHFKTWIRKTGCQRGRGAFIKSGKIPAASVHMSTGMTPCYPSPLSAILIIRLLRTSFSSAWIFLHTCLNATLHCGEAV